MRQRNRKIPAKFEVLIVVHVKAQVFWEVTPCRLVKISFLFSVAEVSQMMVFWMLAMRWAGYVATCWGRGRGERSCIQGFTPETSAKETTWKTYV